MDTEPMDRGTTDTWTGGTGPGDEGAIRAGAGSPRWRRTLLGAALACFALPFLTVTCYGDDVTVSGVQAATTIDITPQADPDPGDRQFAREGEPPNVFAIFALAATVTALALSFGSETSRQTAVWAAASAAAALFGLYLYAFYRSHGQVLPDEGLTGAMTLLVGAAWALVGRVPRWILGAIGAVAVAGIPYSLLSTDARMEMPYGFLSFYAAAVVAVCLAVGAIGASARTPFEAPDPRPSPLRVAIAGVVGLALLAAAAVATPLVLGQMLSAESMGPSIGSSGAFAVLMLGAHVAASALAWGAGRAIAHGGRSRTFRVVGSRAGA